jgi:hypothetical protein
MVATATTLIGGGNIDFDLSRCIITKTQIRTTKMKATTSV